MTIKTKFNLNEWIYIYSPYPVVSGKAKEYKENQKTVYYIGYDRIKIEFFEFRLSIFGENRHGFYGYNKNKIWKTSFYAVKTYKELKKLTGLNIFGKNQNSIYRLKNLSKEKNIGLYF